MYTYINASVQNVIYVQQRLFSFKNIFLKQSISSTPIHYGFIPLLLYIQKVLLRFYIIYPNV